MACFGNLFYLVAHDTFELLRNLLLLLPRRRNSLNLIKSGPQVGAPRLLSEFDALAVLVQRLEGVMNHGAELAIRFGVVEGKDALLVGPNLRVQVFNQLMRPRHCIVIGN